MMKLKRNVGTRDRLIRAVVGALLILLAILAPGPLTLILGIVGAVLLATGLLGICPLYALLKRDTTDKDK